MRVIKRTGESVKFDKITILCYNYCIISDKLEEFYERKWRNGAFAFWPRSKG